MSWYGFSLIAFFTNSFYVICQKKALNLNIPPKIFLLISFVGNLVGFLLINSRHLSEIVNSERLWQYLFWGFLAGSFSLLGQIFSVHAVKKSPNPAYVEATRNGNSIIIAFLAVPLFGSSITWLKLLGIVLVIVGLLPVLLTDKTQNDKKKDERWQLPAIISMFAFAGMILTAKQMTNIGFTSQEILLVLYFFVTLNFLFINRFRFSSDSSEKIESMGLLIFVMTMAIAFVFTANLTHFRAVGVAPNPGYAQAILNSAMISTLVLSLFFFPADKGGQFNWRRWLGVFVVAAGILLIILG